MSYEIQLVVMLKSCGHMIMADFMPHEKTLKSYHVSDITQNTIIVQISCTQTTQYDGWHDSGMISVISDTRGWIQC